MLFRMFMQSSDLHGTIASSLCNPGGVIPNVVMAASAVAETVL